MNSDTSLTEALFEELERQNKDAQRRDDMPGEIWLSGGCTPQTAGCFIDVAALADVALAEPLTMTGCKDAADLIDMANVGRSLMERIGSLAKTPGRYKSWSPADDPAEIVVDLLNDLEDAEARARTAEEANTRQAEALAELEKKLEHMTTARDWFHSQSEGRAERIKELEAKLRRVIDSGASLGGHIRAEVLATLSATQPAAPSLPAWKPTDLAVYTVDEARARAPGPVKAEGERVSREEMARIIDPDRWDALDRRQRDDVAPLGSFDAEDYCKRSLSKADAILSLFPETASVKADTAAEGWRPEVVAFAHLMEQQLRANDHKPGWKSDRSGDLLCRLREETEQLATGLVAAEFADYSDRGARVFHDPAEIAARRCAHVANFAMMIADVSGALKSPAPPPTEGGV